MKNLETKNIIKNNFKNCYFCKSEITDDFFDSIRKKKINKQTFVFFNCYYCKNNLYFWNDQNNKKYFQKKINVVLLEPEIPGNVGTIMRLSVAFDFKLHLIEPFGFIFSKKWLKRSSANHFEQADVVRYYSWENFIIKNPDIFIVLTSSNANQKITDFDFTKIEKPIFLIFGKESVGLPKNLIDKYSENLFKINQIKVTSSINLGHAVSIFVFFVLFQYSDLNI